MTHFVRRKDFVQDLRPQRLLAKVHDRRETNDHAGVQPITVASSADADKLLVDDQLAEN